MTWSRVDIFKAINEGQTVILDKPDLELFLPHRRRALKIDGVVFCPLTKDSITGIKKVAEDDCDLDGHYDEKPVYPGHSIAECANLTAAMLVLLSNENLKGYPTVADFHCVCKRPIFPGETIEINLDFTYKEPRKGHDFYSFRYTATKKFGEISKVVAVGVLTGTAT